MKKYKRVTQETVLEYRYLKITVKISAQYIHMHIHKYAYIMHISSLVNQKENLDQVTPSK